MKTIPAKRKSLEGVKPFKLSKYLSFSSLVVLLVCTLALSAFISEKAKKIVLHKSEQYATLIIENLNHQVFFQFTLPTLITDGEIRLSRESQYERLDKVVRSTLHGFAVESVNIYDPNHVLSYSTEREKIGLKGQIGEVFDRAFKEESVSILSGEDSPFLGFDLNPGVQKLKTYLPMWEEKPMSWKKGKILGVFEISQDMTRDYKVIRSFQLLLFSSSLLFVGILFVTIMIIARRAEANIAARAAERNKMEQQLHQAERLAALGEVIAGVSHEIRNPLGIIRSTAELLHSRIENERQKRLASIMVEEASRLNDLLTEFLDFARPQVLRPSRCKVEEVIERNLKVMEIECDRLGIRVERRYETGDYSLEADCDLLYRAFVNILSNSLQAMPLGGELEIRTNLSTWKDNTAYVEVHFRDTGQGVPPEIAKKIFDPFFTTREKGTGLGLAIVQSVIDNHNGDLEMQSEPGKGTIMTVRLPLVQPWPEALHEIEKAAV